MTFRNELEFKRDKEGTVILHQTYDIGTAAEIAKEVSDLGGGRSKRDSVRVAAYIPPELFRFDPDLIMARVAHDACDKKEEAKYMTKFLLKHPEYKVITPKKYF